MGRATRGFEMGLEPTDVAVETRDQAVSKGAWNAEAAPVGHRATAGTKWPAASTSQGSWERSILKFPSQTAQSRRFPGDRPGRRRKSALPGLSRPTATRRPRLGSRQGNRVPRGGLPTRPLRCANRPRCPEAIPAKAALPPLRLVVPPVCGCSTWNTLVSNEGVRAAIVPRETRSDRARLPARQCRCGL